MEAKEPKPGEGPTAPPLSWAVRQLDRFGLVLPAGWSATKADIFAKVVIGVATSVSVTVLLGIIYGVGNLAGDAFKFAYREARNYVVGLPKADPNAPLSVLVARLAGDDGTQTERVRISLPRAFGTHVGIRVLETHRQLTRGTSGDDLRDRATAETEGRRWLKDSGADILVWGEIAAKDKVYRLRFVQNAAQADRNLRESYLLNDSFELARDFQDDVALVVAAQITSLAAPIFSKKRNALDPLLDDLYARLGAMHRRADQTLDARNTCQVSVRLAAVAQTIGDLRSDVGKLTEAIEVYQSALKNQACSRDREFAPSTKNDLGYALDSLARATTDVARFEQAVAVYREALQGFSREHAPQQWARIQNNLGVALQLLGAMKPDASVLEDSIRAHGSALEIITRERSPFDWAMLQSNLGTTLQMLGLVSGNLLRWQEAIEAYVSALGEFDEEETPIQWGTVQFYLAVMLYETGQRLPDRPNLAMSVTAFQSAIRVFDAANDPSRAQVARTALSIAEAALAARQKAK